jgi:hypothetical protein
MLLTELKDVHRQILDWIDELEALTRLPEPERTRLTGVRWRLSQASRHRTDIIEDHIARLLTRASDNRLLADLQQLRALGVELRQVSADHVIHWTIERIVDDWPGYCRASFAMRASMKARIEEERRVLYPLLRDVG